MSAPLIGSPSSPYGFENWKDWAASLVDFLELQGGIVQELSLTGLTAAPTVLGFEQITNLSGSTALTVPAGTLVAFIQAEGQDIRWRDDGIAPTATVGNIILAVDTLMYAGDFANLRLIEVAASGVVNISYRR